jgi:hypothetical protein
MRRVADDDPRWRQSASGYGCNAAERMDPPPRSLAAEAYDCFMVWAPYGFNRIQAWFARLIAANGGLPSDHGAANHPSAGSLPACQGQALGGAEEAPSLTALRTMAMETCGRGEERSQRRANKGME